MKRAPSCIACGRRLRKFVDVTTEAGRGKRGASNPPELTADGAAPTRGNRGDNAFCNVYCGWTYAVRTLAMVPGTPTLMPKQYLPETLAEQARATARERARHYRDSAKRYRAMADEQLARRARESTPTPTTPTPTTPTPDIDPEFALSWIAEERNE